MAKRFSRYRFAEKINGGEAKANSALEKFLKYEKGETTLNYTRAETSKPGSLSIIYLIPFGAQETDKYQAKISQRALAKLGDLISAVGLFNHSAKAATDVISVNENYVPAIGLILLLKFGEVSR